MKYWNLFLFAEIAAKELLVSPKIKTASGLYSEKTLSIFAITKPIVSAGVFPAASKINLAYEFLVHRKKLDLIHNHNFVLYVPTYAY